MILSCVPLTISTRSSLGQRSYTESQAIGDSGLTWLPSHRVGLPDFRFLWAGTQEA